MAQFSGKYKLDNSENFEQFMQALGVNVLLRKVGSTTKPTLTIQTDDGKHFKFITESTFKNITVEFTLGEEYEATSQDGRETKNVVTLNDDKLTQIEKPRDGKGKQVTYIRELTESGDLKVTCILDDIVATRLYKRI
ncbi:fatty acid-binding protein, liver-like [Acanthaster planci]|uniref:Fatty acid-binding protein, liver-like n=1 Tax=Acanthaster planci TaxID=133434 RepID=A0A8B7ZUW2_ACAPL|nr:fatty acid-binding protein, liver-like [Acanthaster planci]